MVYIFYTARTLRKLSNQVDSKIIMHYSISTYYWPLFPFEKNLLKTRPCFSGTIVLKFEDSDDLNDLCFWGLELIGDLKKELDSVLDRPTYRSHTSEADSPVFFELKAEKFPLCAWSDCCGLGIVGEWKPIRLGWSSKEASLFLCLSLGEESISGGCITLSCLLRRKIVSWHPASFSAAAASSLSCCTTW